MEFIQVDYKENKEKILKKLDAYFIENFPEIANDAESEDFIMKEPVSFSFAIKNENMVLGRIIGEFDSFNSALRINGLIVEKEARGSGAGSCLVHHVEELGRKNGCHISFVNTTQSTAPAFYEKLGYQCLAAIEDYPVKTDKYFFYYKCLF